MTSFSTRRLLPSLRVHNLPTRNVVLTKKVWEHIQKNWRFKTASNSF